MKIGKILNLKKPLSKVKTVKFLILIQIIPHYVKFLQRLCKCIYSDFNHKKYGQDLCLDLLQLSVRRFTYRFSSRKQHKQTAGCMTLSFEQNILIEIAKFQHTLLLVFSDHWRFFAAQRESVCTWSPGCEDKSLVRKYIFKGLVHFQIKKSLIIYSPPCHPRCSFLSFFRWKEIKVFEENISGFFSI